MGFPADGVDNQGWKLYITSLVMIIAAGLFVIARCSTRFLMHKLGSDDAAIIVSLVRRIESASPGLTSNYRASCRR